MSKIISIVNQKGGVGKTTSTINLSRSLVDQNLKVLAIDLDPQANLTMSLLTPYPQRLNNTVSEMLAAVVNRTEILFDMKNVEGIDVIPSKIDLCGSEITLQTVMSRETVLKRLISKIKDNYDYILIDCPPSLGVLSLNALAASDKVIIPVTPDFFAPKGLELLINTIDDIKGTINPCLEIEGILLTRMDKRATFYKDVQSFIQEKIGLQIKVFDTFIPIDVKAAEAPALQMSAIQHDKYSKVARAYHETTKELIKKNNEIER